MGKVYLPRDEWDEAEKDPVKMFGRSVERDRDVTHVTLDMEIIKKAGKENKCPMYDGENLCYLYPLGKVCESGGKLTGGGCLFYGKTLDEIMETFRENVQKYSSP